MSEPEIPTVNRDSVAKFGLVAMVSVILLGLIGTYLNQPSEKTESTPGLRPLADLSQDPSTAAPVTEVVVHVTGAVKNPQVVRLPPGSRVDDAVRLAGPTANADLEALNLAAKLEDGSAIYVPRKGAAAPNRRPAPRPSRMPGAVPIEPAVPADLPRVDPRYLGGRYRVEADPPAAPKSGSAAAQTSRAAETPKASPGGVDLNRATAEQLDTLPGVGPSTAAAILEYRRQHGGFSSLEELLEVKGIGPKKLAKMRPFLRL